MRRKATANNGSAMCCPDGWGATMIWLRYYLARASSALRGGEYDECYVIPSLTGWDSLAERWRRPMAFGGGIDEGASCDGLARVPAPPMLALPEVCVLGHVRA